MALMHQSCKRAYWFRPVPARARKYKPEPGLNPKTNLKPKSCLKNPKVKLGLKNLAMLPSYFDYFCTLKTKSTSQARVKPAIFVNFRPEPGPTYNSVIHRDAPVVHPVITRLFKIHLSIFC